MEKKSVLDAMEIVFTTIYILEIALKWTAWGLWGHYTTVQTAAAMNEEQKQAALKYFVNVTFNVK